MRTTLDINDALLAKAKAAAAREQTSLTRLIEEGLALRLRPPTNRSFSECPRLPVFAGQGGLSPAVTDALSNRALLDAADDDLGRTGRPMSMCWSQPRARIIPITGRP